MIDINIGYDENTDDDDCLSHSNAPLAKLLIIFLIKLDALDTLCIADSPLFIWLSIYQSPSSHFGRT